MRGIFLDIETNGLDFFFHRPIEIAFQILSLESGDCEVRFERLIALSDQEWRQSDPKSLSINGSNQGGFFEKASTKKEVGEEIEELFERFSVHRDNTLFICQNPSFDRPFFSQVLPSAIQEKHRWPYHWLDLASMFWAQQALFHGLPNLDSLSKDEIASALHLEREALPHRAMAGVEHLIACYEKLIRWQPRNQ